MSKTENKNEAMIKAFERVDAGAGRFWRVELEKKVQATPIKVSLMESVVVGKRHISTTLGFIRTIADPVFVANGAKIVLKRVSDYEAVVGEYPVVF